MSERYPLKWTFDIEVNHASILSFLQSYGPCALDFIILDEPEDHGQSFFRWSSSHLNELTDVSQIVSRAAALKALYDGAMLIHTNGKHIVRPSHGPIEVSERAPLRLAHPFEPFGSNWKNWRYKMNESPTQHFVSACLFHARYDETIRHILIFLGANDANWASLYATLDFLKHLGWDEGKLAKGMSKREKEFERFTRTANHFAAIGPAARHGDKGWDPPKKPMSLIEAQMLIFECFRHVVRVRADQIATQFQSTARP